MVRPGDEVCADPRQLVADLVDGGEGCDQCRHAGEAEAPDAPPAAPAGQFQGLLRVGVERVAGGGEELAYEAAEEVVFAGGVGRVVTQEGGEVPDLCLLQPGLVLFLVLLEQWSVRYGVGGGVEV